MSATVAPVAPEAQAPSSCSETLRPAIVVPAHARPAALARLLASLQAADYPFRPVLHLSIDGDAHPDVLHLARAFRPAELELRLVVQPRRLGLKAHLLRCGDLALEYGAVIVLEEDLYVHSGFYRYALAAASHYADDDRVAGVALYSPEFNEYAELPFQPLANGCDSYPMQVSCSWGQCFTAAQWGAFKAWLDAAGPERLARMPGLPPAVKAWPACSWKKFHQAWMVETGRYFIYPYQSYSTNCADPGGENTAGGWDMIQVALPLPGAVPARPRFAGVKDAPVRYDAFMEADGSFVYEGLGLARHEVEIDLYGTKPEALLRQKPRVLSRQPHPAPEARYPLCFRPLENNLLFPGHSSQSGSLQLFPSADATVPAAPVLEDWPYFARMPLGRLVSAVRERTLRRERARVLAAASRPPASALRRLLTGLRRPDRVRPAAPEPPGPP